MHRDRTRILLASLTFAFLAPAFAAVSCVTSEPINTPPPAPTTGAGNTTGAAGSQTGAAGTTGAAGSQTGAAGTTGAAGSQTGAAGTTADAGTQTGSAGTTGAAGTNGAAGTTGNAGTTGTAGTMADAGTMSDAGATLSFANDIYPFIKTQCTPCHITNTDGNLSMKDATTAYSNLVGANMGVAANTDTGCMLLSSAKKRVVPNDPAHSYIYIKISTAQAMLTSSNCGPGMPEKPQSTLTLTAAQIQKISDWISQGAKP